MTINTHTQNTNKHHFHSHFLGESS